MRKIRQTSRWWRQLENTLLQDLKKLADVTGMQPQENVALRELAADVQQQLEKLKRDGVTREESLATISEIQAAITRASGKFDTSQIESQMQDLAQHMAAAKSLGVDCRGDAASGLSAGRTAIGTDQSP